MTVILATLAHELLTSDQPVYLAEHGSNVPHSVLIDGEIFELIDPPTFPVSAGSHPLSFAEDELT